MIIHIHTNDEQLSVSLRPDAPKLNFRTTCLLWQSERIMASFLDSELAIIYAGFLTDQLITDKRGVVCSECAVRTMIKLLTETVPSQRIPAEKRRKVLAELHLLLSKLLKDANGHNTEQVNGAYRRLEVTNLMFDARELVDLCLIGLYGDITPLLNEIKGGTGWLREPTQVKPGDDIWTRRP